VDRPRPEYGLPVAVYKKIKLPGNLSRALPPMGNRNRPIGPSTVPGRAHCPSGEGGIIPFSIFVVADQSTIWAIYGLPECFHSPQQHKNFYNIYHLTF